MPARLCPPDIVENARRTDGSDCGFLLAGDQNRSGAMGSCHRALVLQAVNGLFDLSTSFSVMIGWKH